MVRPGLNPGRKALLLCALLLAPSATAQRFYPDDPVWVDPDNLSIEAPGRIELSGGFDMIENTFGFGTPPKSPIPAARNVNTLGEVPDSSWFTNRIGRRELSLEELRRGPDRTGGPDLSSPATVIRGKSEGITPGFTIKDARGDVYFIKFDPPDYPNMASAADVIGTKFFHAIGFNVPENYVVLLDPENLRLSPDATVSGKGRKDAPMTEQDLAGIFERVKPRPDGHYRAIASLRLSGKPLGPFKFFGVRGDDPNDIFPHQDRRELRGYRLFCAFLNHDDSRAINTLDMLVEEDGHRYVKHHLIDFASTLGSGSVIPQNPRAGNEYLLDFGPLAKAALTLGIWDRPWRKVEYPDFPEIGRFEADFFRPELWRPEHPNQAFQRMLDEDAFWAARILSRFSDQAIRAIVATGRLDDPAAERYLGDCLIKRRDKIVARYLARLNPLHELVVESGQLRFTNLGTNAGLGETSSYEYQWFAFDNQAQTSQPLGEPTDTLDTSIPLPQPAAWNGFLRVRIRTISPSQPSWAKAVDVYLRPSGAGSGDTHPPDPDFVVVGIEREE
jgi:hypothetical protein